MLLIANLSRGDCWLQVILSARDCGVLLSTMKCKRISLKYVNIVIISLYFCDGHFMIRNVRFLGTPILLYTF